MVLGNPDYQRDLSRMLARNNSGKGRRIGSVLQSGLAAAHAKRNFGRQLEFERLALSKKANDVSARHNQRLLNLRSKNLKREGKMMGLTTLLGLGGLGVNYLEGRRRAGLMAQDRARQEEDRAYYRKRDAENQAFNRAMFSRLGNMGPIDGSSYYRGGE